MSYRIKAIETRYKGHLFRSRLEARWAAMFDLLGWQWTYEPFDLNGWVPDFLLSPATGEGFDLLVEVKGPPDEWDSARDKIEAAISQGTQCLLVGASPALADVVPEVGFGQLLDWLPASLGGDPEWTASVLCKLSRCKLGATFDVCSCTGSWQHVLTGYYDGSFEEAEQPELTRLWGEAHKRTRFEIR